MLAVAIETSPLTNREIAERVGFQYPNMVTMLKQGLTKAPLNRIPALEQALDIERGALMRRALHEYEPELFDILTEHYDLPDGEEKELLCLFQSADPTQRQEVLAAIRTIVADKST